ncbi:ankyrin [Lojkania enalia]|uniref:Ankyrin n=1 Tax=Lojkania enalia TaxID=147567 RepID=A0A9P4N144_9PLEO|nr:ankyrin [Didymosphaeria enalia]
MARESPHHNSNNPSKAISKTPQLLSEDLVQQTPGDAITSQEPIQHQPNPSPELYESTRQDEIDQEASAERQITTLAKASSLGSADPSPPYPGDKTQQEPTEKNPGVTPEIWAQFQEFQAFKAMVDMRNSQQEPTPIPQVPQNDEPQSANVTNPETTAAVTLDVGQLHSGRASAEHTAPETQPKSPSKIQQELVIEKDIIIKNNMAMATTTIAVQEVAGLITPPTEDLPPTPTPQSFILEEQMMPSPTENLASTPMPQSFVPEEKMTLPLTPIREDPQLTSQLLEACEKRDVPTIQTLLTNPHLLDLTATGPKGKTLLHLALGTRRLNSSPEELHSLNEAIRLLCAAGIPLNASDASRDESAPLHICATYYFTEAAGHLLDAGADPNVVDKKGRTPLYLIAGDSKPDIELARMLRLKGGNLGGKMFRKQAKPSEKQATVWALIGI